MDFGCGSMAREMKAVVSLLSLAALNNTELLAGGGLGMALVNILLLLRWMPFLGKSLLTVTLMFVATALLHLIHLPNPNTNASVKGSTGTGRGENKSMAVAAAAVMYCKWALPQMLINDQRRAVRTRTTSGACVEAVALHLLFTLALALGLRLGLEGVAMATWCSHLAAMVLSASHHLSNEISVSVSRISLPSSSSSSSTTTNALSVLASTWEVEELGMGMGMELDKIWYDCIVLVAWLLPSPVPSVAAAAVMMRTASLLHALSAALARSYAHFHVVVVCVLGLTHGLLVLMATQMALHQWSHSRSRSTMAAADNQQTLSIIQRATPTLGMWAVAACMQSSAWAYLCRGGGGGKRMGIMAVGARVKLLCVCVVGAPVSLMSAFLFGFGHGVEGLCHGLAAAQVTQAIALTSLMFRTSSANMHMPSTLTANPTEATSEDGVSQSQAGLVEEYVVEDISNLADDTPDSFLSL